MSAFHPFSDMEVRPTGFYKRLGMPMPKIFPKAAPFAGAGKFDKAALFKLGQHGMPAPKTFPHAIHLAGIRLFDKAALLNFVRHGIPMPKAFPKAAPAADAERIDKAARPKLGNAIKTPRTAIQKPRPWAFPTPSLTLTPQSPVVKTRK
jgi:hypothetical protein